LLTVSPARDEHYGNNSLRMWLEACHAVDVVQEASNRHGKPEIVNTDQGSQFTAHEFVQAVGGQGTGLQAQHGRAWSMEG
jgi:hypothetical protein